jgi:hypothetical protein
MARKKEVVRLLHKAFGEVVIKSSFFTASSNSKFFTALCPDGKTRNLLADSEYWKSDKAEVAVGSENSDPLHSGNSEPSGSSRKG